MSAYRIVCGHGEPCDVTGLDGPYDTFAKAEAVKIYANTVCEETPHKIEVMDASTYGHWARAEL